MKHSQQKSDTRDLAMFVREFRKYSKSFFSEKRKLIKKYPDLITAIYNEIEDFGGGGKAIRPYLVYLGYQIGGGGDLKKILPVCLAVELVHNFLLIHDDIIDRSSMRRGKLTIHKRFAKDHNEHYGVSQAIIAGDMACFEAFKLIADSTIERKVKINALQQLADTLLNTGYGEVLDVKYSYTQADLNKIWEVTKLKTAYYSFIGPLIIGATVGEVSKNHLKVIEKYGLSCGLAFQLRDDILGVFGDEKIIGKSVLSDMREGKNTILFYKTRELARGRDLEKLDKLWGTNTGGREDLGEIRNIMINTKAKQWCEEEMMRIIGKAKLNIEEITEDYTLRGILGSIADLVVDRDR